MIWLVTVVLTCGSCKNSELPSSTVEKLDQLLSLMMEQNNIPGAIAGVWVQKEGSWVKAAGTSDIETGTAEETDYRFRIGSITKTFVTTVVLQLADEGKLSLDDKLEKFIQGFKYGDEITIRQLCNNTSGVFAYDDTPGFTELNVAEPQRRWSPGELVDLARAGEPSFPPGTDWKYSNSNFLLQGVIVEQITGNELSSEIDARIAGPLGLASTTLPYDSELGGPHSHGYVEWAGRWGMTESMELDDVTYWDPSWAWAAGGMISNMEDLRKWSKALATGNC